MKLKRLIDFILSIAVLLFASPIWAAAAIAVWLESGRPILFRQQRVGKDLVCFEILKFRTMRSGSVGPSVTVHGDPRTTAVGRFLRATKIDEIPQFWNVLCGDMSIVGPRPEVPEYVDLFRGRFRSILTIRPGITDLASLRFRNEEAILAGSLDPISTYKSLILPAKLDLAEQYLREMTCLSDLRIIMRTAAAMLWSPTSGRPE